MSKRSEFFSALYEQVKPYAESVHVYMEPDGWEWTTVTEDSCSHTTDTTTASEMSSEFPQTNGNHSPVSELRAHSELLIIIFESNLECCAMFLRSRRLMCTCLSWAMAERRRSSWMMMRKKGTTPQLPTLGSSHPEHLKITGIHSSSNRTLKHVYVMEWNPILHNRSRVEIHWMSLISVLLSIVGFSWWSTCTVHCSFQKREWGVRWSLGTKSSFSMAHRAPGKRLYPKPLPRRPPFVSQGAMPMDN